jgi:hypothetical protein
VAGALVVPTVAGKVRLVFNGFIAALAVVDSRFRDAIP